jgi:hypothetical protein
MGRIKACALAGAGLGRGAVAAAAVSGFLALAACGRDRDLPRNEQTVGGITIELGVIPAEIVQGHSTKVGDPNALHGGAPAHSGSHHIVVALFDAKSGARISDARVRAGVGNRSYNHEPDTWLEPMEIAGTTTYGNFFPMPGAGLWRIHLEIFPAGAKQPVRADFAYEHPGP